MGFGVWALWSSRKSSTRIRAPHKEGHFEVIAGKSMLSFRRHEDGDQGEPAGKCFAFVQTFDQKPKRRLFELLKNQGMQENQQIVFLSDGGEDVRNLQLYSNPQAELLLDWFHVTMRLTVMTQTAKGLPEMVGEGEDQQPLRSEVLKTIEHQVISVARQRVPGSPTSAVRRDGSGGRSIREARRDHAQAAQSG